MITKVTKDNQSLYQALYQRTNELCGYTEDNEVSSLDTYFTHLDTTVQAVETALVLPLDEPTFDIDADSRLITVPDCFKKNGVSVQGDQVAEIIYFTIDRYVDATDLALQDIKVVIQWETAPIVIGKTTTTEKGISAAYLKDITLREDQGKLLFGWALNNTITQSAGTIKFAVRFYRADAKTGELIYSFSTLTAQATINPSLDYTWQGNQFAYDIIDDSTMIRGRVQASVQPSDGSTTEPPIFLENYSLPSTFKITLEETDEKGNPVEVTYDAVDLVEGVDSNNNKVLQQDFVVQASGKGLVSYIWYYDDVSMLSDETDLGIKYVPTEDTVILGSHLYYKKKTDDKGIAYYATAVVSLGEEITDDMKDPTKDVCLYEQVSFCHIQTDGSKEITGLYKVVARNKSGTATADAYQEVYVPGPDAETFELVIPEEMEKPVYLNTTTGQAIVSIQGKTARVTDGNMPGDTIVYTWTDTINETVTVNEVINETTSVANTHTITVPSESISSYDEDVAVSVYATRNGTSTEAQTHSYRITAPAQAPTVAIKALDQEQEKYVILNSPSSHVVLQATVENYNDIIHTKEGDGLTFEWYKVVSDEDTFDPTNDIVLLDPEHEDGSPCMTVKDGICTLKYEPDHILIKDTKEKAGSGLFYCKVINTVNGSTAANDVAKITKADCIAITYAS